ncbi:hypothetical protein E6P09_09645 [Haloferax mediterranei ATCC 33500]|uniref:Uncharacterized protein n=3 Tax=Haloferacaceae TaxID=1644056 RepID=I3R477_HALMT|nr:hypothetical protein HFX_1326 [Haloferax mediterranei ATCC 33500]AHZ21604.1 hypothetical protein BM92_02560 [Haloferax mediterranei ATCC 33500]EMA03699.1 hypothetical protein C439_03880 [Haloferax mediterranei ATCC 33500]QCQ76640.1 hypothetical protein E6P09_09645 [Haloferax mediterranei ATCC 33500]
MHIIRMLTAVGVLIALGSAGFIAADTSGNDATNLGLAEIFQTADNPWGEPTIEVYVNATEEHNEERAALELARFANTTDREVEFTRVNSSTSADLVIEYTEGVNCVSRRPTASCAFVEGPKNTTMIHDATITIDRDLPPSDSRNTLRDSLDYVFHVDEEMAEAIEQGDIL